MVSKEMLTPLKAFLTGLSLGKKIAFGLLIGGTFAALMALVFWSGKPEYQPLYSNLLPEDAGAVVEQLKAANIPYEVTAGNTIRVPKEQVFETTMMLAAQGLPRGGGVGFEIFDNSKLGMTEFEQNVSYQRALQGELARTISQFDEVRSCRVHIVMATRSLFVRQEKPASASIIVEMMPGRRLNQKQIQGIIHLVSASVQGLMPEHVTLVDSGGNLLTGVPGAGSGEQPGTTRFDMQQRIERNLEMRVKTMLEEVLGPGRSIVRISCDLNFDKQEMTEERYDPDKVVRSEQISDTATSGQNLAGAGVPGVLSNMSERGRGTGQDTEQSSYAKRDQTTNYEISKTVRHVVNPVGSIARISAAVIVDGSYRTVPRQPAADAGAEQTPESDAAQEPQEEVQYMPRTAEELETLTKIVQRAVNYSEERGDQVEVVNLRFVTSTADEVVAEEPGWKQTVQEYWPYIKYLLVAMAAFLVYLLILRPLIKWITFTPAIDGQLLKQLPMTVGEIEKGYDVGQIPMDEQLQKAVADNRERTLQLIREWIAEK